MQAFDNGLQDYLPASRNIGIHVEVSDPSDKIVLSRVSPHISEELFHFSWCYSYLQTLFFFMFFLYIFGTCTQDYGLENSIIQSYS